jgi:RNA-splicing ligase RtcB
MDQFEHKTTITNSEAPDNPAIVYLHDSHIQPETEAQIKSMISNPSIVHARVMPDCHVGHGCCVGFTAFVEYTKIVPSYVGGDIGCGILSYPIKKIRLNLKSLERKIKNTIPMGNGHQNIYEFEPVEQSFIERYIAKANSDAEVFATNNNIQPCTLDYDYFISLCSRIGIDVSFCVRSFGTLGGGNHYIEVNQDPGEGQYYLTIHSGSRAFGMQLFEYHNAKVDPVLRCLNVEDSIQYCYDMILAQRLAQMNRHIMLQLILREISVDFDESELIESTHNYVDFRKMVLRKGAISAELDEMCIVSLNMRDGILLCRGRGNAEWNWSCAHGCGRLMSRSEARRRIKMTDFKKAMKDVVTTSVCQETLDEAPQAYKDMGIIIDALQPTVEVVKHLVSVVNLKGSD